MTAPLALAVVGAGAMARRRLTALMATGRVRLCGVVARRRQRAEALASEFGGAACFDDLDGLAAARPDAVLLEVPHDVQDGLAAAVVARGWHLLVGGPLATSLAAGTALTEAAAGRVVVEAGFEARYRPVWENARALLADGTLGTLVAVQATALWAGDPDSWYYDEQASGGMPLTHMTYCFVNPLRWLLGEPSQVAAMSNSLIHHGGRFVRDETCAALLRFPGDVVASLTAGYVKSAEDGSWRVTLIGHRATLDVEPTEMGAGRLRLRHGDSVAETVFPPDCDGFRAQAEAFLDAIAGSGSVRNPPAECLGDLRVVEAIRGAVVSR
ncbi:MAG TPA: Gfo/Idh/MocA family oxidoreductase [Candidatus Omnitrophota bacterium]|nr:Gfo/Idh/MocA family oxidoreductase [Candidatus Omnitrophota bacterium]